jgi:glucokinase
MILAGDIGATKTTLALFREIHQRFEVVAEDRFQSGEHDNLEEMIDVFLSKHPHAIQIASFGVAGPVKDGRCKITNLPWGVDSQILAEKLALKSVYLINDLEANAYGIGVLNSKDFLTLNEGASNAWGNAAIIAAGTGLGEAGLYWDGKSHHPFAGEGGHVDFAPRNEMETELLSFLRQHFDHVTYENILSGSGIYNIYRFLNDAGYGEEPAWLKEEIEKGDPAAVISGTALAGKNDLCNRTLELFISIYGAEAGNLSLKVMATRGLFVGGGIAPKILIRREDDLFMNAFLAKGRLRDLMEGIPVHIILNEKTALLGAANFARLCAADKSLHLPQIQ